MNDHPLPRGAARRFLVALAIVILGLGACEPKEPSQQLETSRTSPRQEVRRLLAAGWSALDVADTTGADSTWAWVREFYARRSNRLAWSSQSYRRARQLVEVVQHLNEAGLDPADYGAEPLARLLAQVTKRGPVPSLNRAQNQARLDVGCTWAFVRAAIHLRDGRVPRGVLDKDWTPKGRGSDWFEWLVHDYQNDDPDTLFTRLEPHYEGYRRLREALAHYDSIAAAGGWEELPPGPPIGVGQRGPRVARLIRRLAMTGDLPAAHRDTVYDAQLTQAVGELQTRNGIPRSGIVGEATRALLNVPVATRIRQIELNMERWRWLPDSLGHHRVDINIPAYHLELVQDDTLARGMRVVVGKRASPTPVFTDAVVYVDVNPTWTLPPSVLEKELVPAMKKKHDYLAANRMFVVSINSAKRDTVDPKSVPWEMAGSDSFMYLVIQSAGNDNPLGRVKLMCPNEYDVYLHDTPQRSRFGVATRDYSHGCVRVEEAVALADSLLKPVLADTMTVDSMVARNTFRRVRLQHPVPVHFLYWTAWADSVGRVSFRDDLYGLEGRLDTALRTRTPAQLELNPGVGLSAFWLAAEAKAREAADRAASAGVPRKR